MRDKLPALSGIAAMVRPILGGDRYVAGMWEKTLLYELLWSSKWLEDRSCVLELIEGPSWTWASVYAPIDYFTDSSIYPRNTNRKLRPFSAIMSIDCVSQGENPFAGFVEGCVEIEGLVTWGTITFERTGDGTMHFRPRATDQHLIFRPDTALDAVESHTTTLPGLRRVNTIPNHFEATLACIWICTYSSNMSIIYGLAITELESRPGYFTRVGYLECHDLDGYPQWLFNTLPGSRRCVCLV